jgi:hypothetical protein
MAAESLKSVDHQLAVLGLLLPHFPEAERLEILTTRLDAYLALDQNEKEDVLTRFAPYLNFPMLSMVLSDACSLDEEVDRARCLIRLAPHLQDKETLQAHAVAAARSISEDRLRLHALAAYYLSDGGDSQLLGEIRVALVRALLEYGYSTRTWLLREIGSDFFGLQPYDPRIVPAPVLREIAGSIVEIWRDWRWA